MKGWSIIIFQRTQVNSEVDRTLVDSLVHGDGEPGGLVEVGVDVSQVGGVVVLNKRVGELDVRLSHNETDLVRQG